MRIAAVIAATDPFPLLPGNVHRAERLFRVVEGAQQGLHHLETRPHAEPAEAIQAVEGRPVPFVGHGGASGSARTLLRLTPAS